MADKFVSERNLRFLLYEVFDAPKITQYTYYASTAGRASTWPWTRP